MTNKELARYLRCVASAPGEKWELVCGPECPYFTSEPVIDEFRGAMKPDGVIDGQEVWYSCDCDRISFDAAERLESIAEETE